MFSVAASIPNKSKNLAPTNQKTWPSPKKIQILENPTTSRCSANACGRQISVGTGTALG
jgi:hypothetical protein